MCIVDDSFYIDEQADAYNLTQVIGHIARNKNFKGIIAPSSANKPYGKNFISFKEF